MKKSIIICGSLLFISFLSFAQNSGFEAQGPPENSVFPKFDYVTIDGDSVSSNHLADKIVVVNIWFVGCTGCKQEEPYLRNVTRQYQEDDGIVFLGFCMTKPDRIQRYLEKHGEIGYKNISLTRDEVQEKYHVRMSPSHFLIKNGVLVAKHTGPILPGNTLEWFEDEIMKMRN